MPRIRHALLGAVLATSSLSLGGCNLNKMVANQTAGLFEAAAPSLDAFWDYDIAGAGAAGGIVQLEAMYSISPDNEGLALNLAKAYVGYAVGWVENQYEVAYAKSEFDSADRLRQRTRLLYLRARNLALRAMRNRDAGIDAALKGTPEELASYLKKHYGDKDDVGPVFWAGMAWGAAINMSLDQPDLLADLPTAKALVTRAMELDDMFFNGGAYIFLGSMEAAFPAALGGNPEKGKELFEKGLERTQRRNHMLQVSYAKLYAVNTSNPALYHKLLMEVIESPDLGNEVRLSNKIARVRAERYLAQMPELF